MFVFARWTKKLCAGLLAGLAVTLAAHAANPVRIGFGISKTGPLAGAAAGPLVAYELWRDQINAKGGLDVGGERRPVQFVVYDDQSDTGKIAGIYEKLITDDRVDLLLSPWGTHSHFAVVGVLEKHHFPMMGSTAASQQIRQLKAKNIWFPTSAIPDSQGAELAQMLKTQGVKTVAVNTVQIGYPMENRRALIPALKQAGIKVVMDGEYAPDIKDMTPILAGIKRANPDAIITLSYPPDAILYMKGAREQGINKPFQFLLVGPTAAFFKKMFDKNLDGIVTMGHWSPDKKDWPQARAFFDAYVAKTNEAPDYLDAVLAYTSAQILEQAVAKAGLDKDKLRATMASTTFDTINGPIRFDGVQNAITPTMFLQFQKGVAQIVYPPSMATAPWQPKTGWAN